MTEVADFARKAAKFCRDSVVLWMYYASLPVHDTLMKRANVYTQALSSIIESLNKPEVREFETSPEKQVRLSWGIFALVVQMIQAYIDCGDIEEAKKKLKACTLL